MVMPVVTSLRQRERNVNSKIAEEEWKQIAQSEGPFLDSEPKQLMRPIQILKLAFTWKGVAEPALIDIGLDLGSMSLAQDTQTDSLVWAVRKSWQPHQKDGAGKGVLHEEIWSLERGLYFLMETDKKVLDPLEVLKTFLPNLLA